MNENTKKELEIQMALCREMFMKKMEDYGTSWSIMRPTSLTDQIYIKAKRVRTLEKIGASQAAVDEGIEPEFVGIINYAAMELIQLARTDQEELIDRRVAEKLYDKAIHDATSLLFNKNHDYDDAWREMRISSITDIILQKLLRTKEIEDNDGITKVSEGVDANMMDIINYAFFALIKLAESGASNS